MADKSRLEYNHWRPHSSPAYEALAVRTETRQRRWSAYVHQTPDSSESAAIRRSNEMGLPRGNSSWIDRLTRRLKLDLTIRPRGRPRKSISYV
jgi:putative transposase